MNYKTLGKDLVISAVGLGCMGFSHAYGAAIEEKEAEEKIRAAYDMGDSFFDTAECYIGTTPDGSISYNEELVGRALHDVRKQPELMCSGLRLRYRTPQMTTMLLLITQSRNKTMMPDRLFQTQ